MQCNIMQNEAGVSVICIKDEPPPPPPPPTYQITYAVSSNKLEIVQLVARKDRLLGVRVLRALYPGFSLRDGLVLVDELRNSPV